MENPDQPDQDFCVLSLIKNEHIFKIFADSAVPGIKV
jgi:hypothetical protein